MLATAPNVAVERDLIDATSVPNLPNFPSRMRYNPQVTYQ